MNKIEIENWLNKYDIKNYELISDNQYGYVVNVKDSVNLEEKDLISIDVQFNKIIGSFYCGKNKLKSLKGSPNEVVGDFYCQNNELTSLKYSPKIIHGSFIAYLNKLENLEYFPKKVVNIIDLRFNDKIKLLNDNVLIGSYNIFYKDIEIQNRKIFLEELSDKINIINHIELKKIKL